MLQAVCSSIPKTTHSTGSIPRSRVNRGMPKKRARVSCVPPSWLSQWGTIVGHYAEVASKGAKQIEAGYPMRILPDFVDLIYGQCMLADSDGSRTGDGERCSLMPAFRHSLKEQGVFPAVDGVGYAARAGYKIGPLVNVDQVMRDCRGV